MQWSVKLRGAKDMIKDEYIQKVPNANSIIIDEISGVIYLKNNKPLRQGVNASNDNILLEFLNMDSNADYIKFISKYGILDNQKTAQQHYKVVNARKIMGYTPITAIDEFREMQVDVKSLLDIFPGIYKLIKNPKIEYDFKIDEIEWILNDSIIELNNYVQSRKIRIAYTENFKFYDEVLYTSLRQVIYCKLANVLTGEYIPRRCEKCHEQWVPTVQKNRIYCDNCRKTAATQKQRNKKKNDVKEQVYLKVYGHFFTKFERGKDYSQNLIRTENGEPCMYHDEFNSTLLAIKKNSDNFYSDLDNLCKKVCSCRKCQAGLATYFKNKIEKKLQSE